MLAFTAEKHLSVKNTGYGSHVYTAVWMMNVDI